jgi:hypothetical protein
MALLPRSMTKKEKYGPLSGKPIKVKTPDSKKLYITV